MITANGVVTATQIEIAIAGRASPSTYSSELNNSTVEKSRSELPFIHPSADVNNEANAIATPVADAYPVAARMSLSIWTPNKPRVTI